MSVDTLDQCDCVKGLETCGEICACCDSPYAVGTCACDCVSRRTAALFDIALADPAAYDAVETTEYAVNPLDLEAPVTRHSQWVNPGFPMSLWEALTNEMFTDTYAQIVSNIQPNAWFTLPAPAEHIVVNIIGGPS